MFEALEGHLSEISLPVLSWVNPSTLGWGRLDVASWVMGGAKGTGSSDSSNRFWEPFPCKKLENYHGRCISPQMQRIGSPLIMFHWSHRGMSNFWYVPPAICSLHSPSILCLVLSGSWGPGSIRLEWLRGGIRAILFMGIWAVFLASGSALSSPWIT